MTYAKDTQIVVIRFATFRQYDFVEEHNKVFRNYGDSWMLKSGRNIPSKSLKTVIESGGNLILKAPKKAGGKYYCAKILDYSQGMPLESYQFPSYYLQFSGEYNKKPLDGTWLKIEEICEMKPEDVNQMILCSNKKPLTDAVNSTRTSVMYVEIKVD